MKKIFLFLLGVTILAACGTTADEIKNLKKTAESFYLLLSEQDYESVANRFLSDKIKNQKDEWKTKLEIIQSKNGKLITYSFGEVTFDYVDSAKEYVAEVQVKVKYEKISTKERLILHRSENKTSYKVVGYVTEILE